ncbi:MAG TPA: efflux RND transporter periplasmic adaptor subunit [Rhodanobacteraceae bacterium]|nr:efflux RND transporter periplasmic adaptor subunit [Rhodanobacteraceae bacterium]
MSDDLLKELRLGRDQREDDETPRRWPWIVGVVVLLMLIGAGAAVWALRGSAIEVEAATATPISAGGAANAVLQATGYVVARRQATVSAQIVGTLTEVLIEEADHVDQGQVLARLDDSAQLARLNAAKAAAAAAHAQLGQVRAQLNQAEQDLTRQEALVARHLVSRQAAEQARTEVATLKAQLKAQQEQAKAADAQIAVAQVDYDYTVVRAPFAGVITQKAAQVGEIIAPSAAGGGFTRTGVGTIVDMDSLEVDVDVNEAYIGRVKPGMPVEAVLDAYPDWTIPAHVIAIVPTADRGKATVKVRIALEKKDPRIIPEMGVRVSFLEQVADQAGARAPAGVLVPASAVVERDGKPVVFIIDGDHARRAPVSTGGNRSGYTEVTAGLAAGTRVVKAPPATLEDGAAVRIKSTAAGG